MADLEDPGPESPELSRQPVKPQVVKPVNRPVHLPRWRRLLQRYKHPAWVVALSLGLVLFWWLLPGGFRAFVLHGLLGHPFLSGMVFSFAFLALSLLWSIGQTVDSWVFLHINLHHTRPVWLDWGMLWFTQLGNGTVAFVLALLAFGLRQRRLAFELVLGTLSLWLLVELIKAAIRRPRPFIALTQARIVGSRVRGRSFPSGHTSQAFFLATLLVQVLQPGLLGVILLYTAAALVGITRMYVGAHYPRDVVAGAILGSLWGVLGAVIEGRF